MANMSDYLESGLLHHVFRGASFVKPTGMAIALTSGVPVESGNALNLLGRPDGTNKGFLPEIPSGDPSLGDTGYARVNLNPPETHGNATWKFATDEEFAVGSGFIKNCNTIYFGTALTEWGWVSGIALCDDDQWGSGALIMQSALDNPRYVYKGDSLKFDAGQLRIQFK